jgi:outer membrane protein OmpA-like peptidoglycan-associated protein
MNLFESFDNILADGFIDKLNTYTTDNLGDFEIASKGIFYTLVAGLIRRSNSDMSAGMLFNQVNERYQKVGSGKSLDEKLKDKSSFDELVKDGSKVLSQIFPAYKSPLLSMIGQYANTSKNNTLMFSGLISSILVDLLGKKINAEKMTKEDLSYFIKQHHESLFEKAPDALMEKMIPALGLQELTNMKFSSQKKNENVVEKKEEIAKDSYEIEVDSEPRSYNKLLLILIGVIVAALVGYLIYQNKDQISIFNSEETPVEVLEDSAYMSDTLEIKDSLAAEVVLPVSNNDLTELKAYVAGNEPAGKEFEMKSFVFFENSFELKPESLPEVDSLYSIIKNDKNIQIKITGFSPQNDEKLNVKRAFAIKKLLSKKGIDLIRLDAVSGGVGGDFPKMKIVQK